jgi:hypothetical protein
MSPGCIQDEFAPRDLVDLCWRTLPTKSGMSIVNDFGATLAQIVRMMKNECINNAKIRMNEVMHRPRLHKINKSIIYNIYSTIFTVYIGIHKHEQTLAHQDFSKPTMPWFTRVRQRPTEARTATASTASPSGPMCSFSQANLTNPTHWKTTIIQFNFVDDYHMEPGISEIYAS